MRVWMVTIGEPLPTDGDSVRLLRCGILSDLLVQQGHEVLWWTSTFDHTQKRHRFSDDAGVALDERYRLRLLHGRGYPRNISWERLADHRTLARKFSKLADKEARPDVVLCSFPTIELSREAIRYGRRTGVPVVVDVRDPWPDVFVNAVPQKLQGLGRMALRGMASEAHEALRGAVSLTSTAEGYLNWGLKKAQRPRGECDRVFPLGYRKPVVTAAELRDAERKLWVLGVDPTKTICWFIGSFGRHYDLETVIRGARELANDGDQRVQFVLSGDGDLSDRWHGLARGLKNVVFTGWIDVPAIAALFNVAQIGLAAIEGVPDSLPNKLSEYLAGGLAVLSSLGGETASLLREHECGLTYRPRDPASFVTALTSLLDDPEKLTSMRGNAAKLYEDRFSASVVYSQMANYLFEIATKEGRSTQRI